MFKIIFITTMFDNMYTLNKVCANLNCDFPGKFKFSFFTGHKADTSDEKYEALLQQTEKCDLICLISLMVWPGIAIRFCLIIKLCSPSIFIPDSRIRV